jgi:hypothetical protein
MASPQDNQHLVCNEREEARRITAVHRLDQYRQRLDGASDRDQRDTIHRAIADELAADHTNLAGCAAALLSTRLRPPEQSPAYTALAALRDSDPASKSGTESAACLRLIAQVGAHWGAGVLERYAWASRARSFLERLWAVAELYADWAMAVRYLNAVLVLRHELVLSGRLSASTRTWQTIGNEVDQGLPGLRYSPITAADLKNVIDWAEKGVLEHGGITLQSLEEAEESVTLWTTATEETIQFRDGSSLSARPQSLWSKCMIACDTAGLIVREDTLRRPPQRYPSGIRRSTKRPRSDDVRIPTSETDQWSAQSDIQMGRVGDVAGTSKASTTGLCENDLLNDANKRPKTMPPMVSLGSGITSETEANDLEGPDDSNSEGSDSASDSGSSESPDTDASDQEEVDKQAAAISQPSLENSALSDADTEDAGMHSESGLSTTPQGAGTEQTDMSPPPDTQSDDESDALEGQVETPVVHDDDDGMDMSDSNGELHSSDCPLCEGQCKAGYVPQSVWTIGEDQALAQQQRMKGFKQIHEISDLVAQRRKLDVKSNTLRAWATPTRLASMFFDPDDSSLSTASKEDADVWCLTTDTFQSYTDAGVVFDRPILMRNAVRDANWMTWEHCKATLGRKLAGHILQVRNPYTHVLEDIDGEDFVETLASPDAALNALNLPGIVRGDKPFFTLLPRYRLLEDLVHSEAWDDAGKQVTTKELDIFWCICFNILGLRGAFSGAHLDALNGTWVRSFCGRKAWMFVPPQHLSEDDLRRLARYGDNYNPRGKARTLMIEPDETLLMPAGSMIIHAVLTLENSLMEGGMLWDELSVNKILENMLWMAKNQQSTNKPWPNHIQALVKQLDRAVVSNTSRFTRGPQFEREFLSEYEERSCEIQALPCKCISRCGKLCQCRANGRRCTPECKSHAARELRCLQEA